MKSHYIFKLILFFTSILFFLNFIGCKKSHEVKQPELSGYFMINHRGEENKPIPSFILKTRGDTTYQQITRYTNGRAPGNIELNRLEIYEERDIADCNIATYSKFKNVILEYHKNNRIKHDYEAGTFEIYLTDNIDTLTFIIARSEYAKSFFRDLEQVAQEYGLEKAADRFEKYKNMQPK